MSIHVIDSSRASAIKIFEIFFHKEENIECSVLKLIMEFQSKPTMGTKILNVSQFCEMVIFMTFSINEEVFD